MDQGPHCFYDVSYNICQPAPPVCGIYLNKLAVSVTSQSKGVLYLNDEVLTASQLIVARWLGLTEMFFSSSSYNILEFLPLIV